MAEIELDGSDCPPSSIF